VFIECFQSIYRVFTECLLSVYRVFECLQSVYGVVYRVFTEFLCSVYVVFMECLQSLTGHAL
jgi:hypothetical protein